MARTIDISVVTINPATKPLSWLLTLSPIQLLLSRAGVAATLLLALSPLFGCGKQEGTSMQTDKPPRRASSLEQYGELCSHPPQPFDGARAYEKGKAPSLPSKVVVFTRDTDDKAPAYRLDLTTKLDPFGTKPQESGEVELVVCTDLKRKGTPTYCNYGYKNLLYYAMDHTVRVLEAKTGKELLRDEFSLERKETCPTSYAFPSDADTVYRGADFGPMLRHSLRPLEDTAIASAPTAGVVTSTAASGDVGAAEDASKELKAYMDKLAALGRAVGAVRSPVKKKCVDADLGEGGPVDGAEEEALAALANGTNLPPDTVLWPIWRNAFGPRFADLVEMKAKDQPTSKYGWTAEAIRSWNAEKYLLVIRSGRRVMPKWARGPEALSGFLAGHFKGWLFVGDLEAGKVLCQAPLAFSSSSRIQTAQPNPLELDFTLVAKTAVRGALADVTEKLKPHYFNTTDRL